MGKKRVYELAKELGLDNKAIIARLKQMGIEVASHSSTIDDVDASNLILSLEREKKDSQSEKRVMPGIIRRRAKKEEPAQAAPEQQAAETEAEPVEEPQTHEVEEAAAQPEQPVVEPAAVETAEQPLSAEPESAPPKEEQPTAAEAVPPPPSPVEPPQTPAPSQPQAAPQPKPQTGRHDQPAIRPRREYKLGLQIVGPPIPLRDLEARGGIRTPVPSAEDRAKQAASTPAATTVKRPVVEEVFRPDKEKDKDKAPKKKGAMRRMKELDRREIFKETDSAFGGGRMKRKIVKKTIGKTEITTPKASKRIVKMDDNIQVGELARRMGIKAGEIIKKLMGLGVMATLNNTVDYDTATLIAHDLDWEVQKATADVEQKLSQETASPPESLKGRPPIVTVMGHVDHGKTSLLDAIRSTNKVEQEAGGITQHIGAYQVTMPRGTITFLDTPGHEAFTDMRARGAMLTDLVILVVAADDGIQPQTVEAINHAKEAQVPIIVAINKIDKPNAQPERVKQALTEHGLVTEEWGGETLTTMVSAKLKQGIEGLLEQVLLQSEMLELKANPDRLAKGVVIESRLDRGRGPIVTVLVKEGTLKSGDPIVAGQYFGKVRAMFDDKGAPVTSAGPSTPVEVIGLNGVPMAGDPFNAAEDERLARDVAERRSQETRQASLAKDSKLSLESLLEGLKEGEVKTFKVVLKADVNGSMAPISDALTKMSTDKVKIRIIHAAVGGITESDVSLASASGAIVIGFNVRPETSAQELAGKMGIEIRSYNVIYDLIDDVRKAASGLLAPRVQEKYLGRAQVKQIFNLPKVGTVAGCSIIDGKVTRAAKIRLLRDNVVVYQGKLASLKHFKDDVREVSSGNECGLSIENYSDLKPGDQIEAFEIEEIAQTI
jgi:translation initiation factor IF-2